MSQEHKTKEIIIISDCEGKSYKVGLELYKKYTNDEFFNGKEIDENDPRTIHPTHEKQINGEIFKIHFFDNQDRYWPALSHICRHCDGVLFALDLDDNKDINEAKGETSTEETPKEANKSKEEGEEDEDSRIAFIDEWLVNLYDLDKEDINKVIVGVTNSSDSFNVNERWKLITELGNEKKIDCFRVNLAVGGQNEIENAFNSLAKIMTNGNVRENEKPNEDEELAEYLDIYMDF